MERTALIGGFPTSDIQQDLETNNSNMAPFATDKIGAGSNEPRPLFVRVVKVAFAASLLVTAFVLVDLFSLYKDKPAMRIDSAKLTFESTASSDATLTVQGGLKSNSAFHSMEVTAGNCELQFNEDGKPDHWMDIGSVRGTKTSVPAREGPAASSLSFEFQNTNFASLRRLLYATTLDRPLGAAMRCAVDVNLYMYHTVTVSSRVLVDVQVLSPSPESATVILATSALWAGNKFHESVTSTEIDRTALFAKSDSVKLEPGSFNSLVESFPNVLLHPQLQELHVDTSVKNPFYQMFSSYPLNSFVVAVPAMVVATTAFGDDTDGGRFVVSSTAFEMELMQPTLHLKSDIKLQCSDSGSFNEAPVTLRTCEMPDPADLFSFYQKMSSNRLHLSMDAVSHNFVTKLAGTHHSLQAESTDVATVDAQIKQRLSAAHSVATPTTAASAVVASSQTTSANDDVNPPARGSCVMMDADGMFSFFMCADEGPASMMFRMHLLNETAMLVGASMHSAWAEHGPMMVHTEMEMSMAEGQHMVLNNTISENMHSMMTSMDYREQGESRMNVDAAVNWKWDPYGDNLQSIELHSRIDDRVFSGLEDLHVKSNVSLTGDKFSATAMAREWTVEAQGAYFFNAITNWFVDFSKLQISQSGQPKLTGAGGVHVDDMGVVAVKASAQDAHSEMLGNVNSAFEWHKPHDRSWTTDGHFNVSSMVHLPFANLDWNVMSNLNYEHEKYAGAVWFDGEKLVHGDGSFGHRDAMWWFSAREASLQFQGKKLGNAAVNLRLDTSHSATGMVAVHFGEEQQELSTEAVVTWSDPAMFADQMHLNMAANTTIPSVGTFGTAGRLNYDDQGRWSMDASTHDQSHAELFMLLGHGRYELSSSLWLLAADDVVLSVGGSKLVSVVTAINFTSTQQAMIRHHLLVRDGSNELVARAGVHFMWSDLTLIADKLQMGLAVNASLPFAMVDVGSLSHVDFEHQHLSVGTSWFDKEGMELFLLRTHGHYEETSSSWLLAADDVSVHFGGKKIFSFSTGLDSITASQSALRYHVLVRDGSDKLVTRTNGSVAWAKPHHTTWDEAGNFRVQSTFESFVGQSGSDEEDSRKLTLIEVESVPVCTSTTFTLDLSYQNLTELPDLSTCTQLRVLNIEGNWLTYLPESLFGLSTLVELNAQNNDLMALNNAINRLDMLESLYLQDNELTYLPVEIGGLASLLELHVDGNKLTTLPDEIGDILTLELLSAGSNDLQYLPYGLRKCAKLLFLYANGNSNLNNFPYEYYSLTKLRVINMYATNINYFPNWVYSLPDLEVLHYDNEPNRRCDSTTTSFDLSSLNYYDFSLPSFEECINLEYLDLSGNHLEELPLSVFRLSKLTTLRLGSNRLQYLPTEIEALSELTVLELPYNQLQELPEEIGGLLNLVSLHVAGNSLTALPYSIGQMTNLTGLEASYNRISFVPVEIGSMISLERLYLTGNSLTFLPTQITQLSNLQYLGVSNNYALTSLPMEIGDLTALISLNARSCNLLSLPASVGKLVNLEFLYLSYNRNIPSLPQDIGNLVKLRELLVESNQISVVPYSIGNCVLLERFYINNNLLSELPDSVSFLSKLYQLNAGSNGLRSLPVSIGNLSSLSSLELDYNPQLHTLPDGLYSLPFLYSLSLSRCNIASISPRIGELQRLYFLGLSGNQLASIPSEITTLSSLIYLDLSDNKLSNVPLALFDLTRLTDLGLSNNPIMQLPSQISQLQVLRSLRVSNCSLQSLPWELSLLTNLQTIDISWNMMYQFPVMLCYVPALENLYANNIGIYNLPPDIGRMKSLRDLQIRNNWLTELPSQIGNMTRLQNLYVGSNRLMSLPQELATLPDLRYLDVSFNQLYLISPEILYKAGLYVFYYGNPGYQYYYDDYNDDGVGSFLSFILWNIGEVLQEVFFAGWDVNLHVDYRDNMYTAELSESTMRGKQNLLIKGDGDFRSINSEERYISARAMELHFRERLIGSVSGQMNVRIGDKEDIDVNLNGFVHDSKWQEVFAVNATAMLQLSAPSNGTCSVYGQADTTFIELSGRADYAGQTYDVEVSASDDNKIDENFAWALTVPSFVPNLCMQPKVVVTKPPTAMPSAHPTMPTTEPTLTPSVAPNITPSPSVHPSQMPSKVPSRMPSLAPSNAPVDPPTRVPSATPSLKPSAMPSLVPSAKPSAPTHSPSLKPSRQPSIRPTSAPSTAAPTLKTSAPVISSATATAHRSSISLAAVFDAATAYGGSVTCAAFADEASITSNQQILTASISKTVPYLANVTSVSVEIAGLSAMNDYDVYCVVVTHIGVPSIISDTLATKRDVETACCKVLAFSNAPAFVYGSLTQYTTAQPNQYVFSYTLSAAPRNSVTITPTLVNLDGSAVSTSVVSVSPASSAFASTGNNLAGKFVLSAASASLSGSYKIILVPSGTSAAQYSNVTIPVSVISSSAPKPAPALTSAKFANNGGSLEVSFSSATNKGSIAAQSFACSQLLMFPGDSTATCSWVNGASLRVVLTTSGVTVGSTLTLKASLIKAECAVGKDCSAYVAAAQQSVSVAAPDAAVVPVVLLTTPASVSSCDDVVIDPSLSTGSGGRAWASVVWTVSKSDALGAVAVPAVLAALNNRGVNIATPIVLDRTLFAPSKYTLTLTLTNFLGQSSIATAIFGVDENPNLPIVSILGPAERSLSPVDTLNLFTTTTQASCAEKASTISYKWTVLENGATVTKTSFSATPTKFSLLPYQLNVGSVYTFVFEATAKATANTAAITGRASTTVKIVSGAVVVTVVGGYKRQVPTVGQLNIDASPSYDENVQSRVTTGLTFAWTCTYATPSKFGESCASVMGVSSASNLVVDATLLDSSELYAFQVVAKAADGRSALAVVTVQPQLAGSTTYTSINSLVTKINADSRVSLIGVVRATYGLDCTWTAAVDGVNVPFNALTPTAQSFSRVAVRNNFAYGLLVPGSTFVPGSSVTFRLKANFAGDNNLYAAFSEINIKVNAAPSGGSVDVNPTSGSALSTPFVLSTAGWTDDAEDFPLSYQFQYQTLASQQMLNLQSRSPANKVSANLPAGHSSSGNAVILVCTVFDASLAAATLSTTATVTENAAIDVTQYVNDQLSNFDSVGDVNTVGQLIANVGSTVNQVNCTLASDSLCAFKNRASCSATAQTCSGCLDGFSGVPGDSNALCFSTVRRKLSAVEVGGTCAADGDCLFGKCAGGKCVSPPKLCPSDTTDMCSGHGSCKYTTRSGKPLNKVCTESDFECIAQCECTDGYGGRGCGLSPEALNKQDNIRSALCNAVITVGNNSDPSVQLLESLVGYLDTAFDAKEVISAHSLSICQGAMHFVGDLVLANGELVKDMAQTKLDQLLKTASKFVARRSTASAEDGKYIHQLISTLNEAILGSMVNGQAPYSYATQNMRTIISKARIGEVTSLAPPQTDEEVFYGGAGVNQARNSYIEVVNTSTSSQFANSEGYMSMVVMLWGENPFHGASSVESTLLRVENHNFNSAHRTLSTVEGEVEQANENTMRQLAATEQTDYYIVVQLNEHHAFDRSHSISEATALGLTNFTFPECTNFDGSAYEACAGCSVSTYTDYNVTFACSASAAAASRRLSGSSDGSVNQFGAKFATPNAVPTDDDPDSGSSSNSADNLGLIIGLAVGIPVGLLLLALIAWACFYWCAANNMKKVAPGNDSTAAPHTAMVETA